jgi:hypothetical protein
MVNRLSISRLFVIFLLDLGIVPMVQYFVFFILSEQFKRNIIYKDKMKNKYYHTVGTVPKSNRNLIE